MSLFALPRGARMPRLNAYVLCCMCPLPPPCAFALHIITVASSDGHTVVDAAGSPVLEAVLWVGDGEAAFEASAAASIAAAE